MTQDTIHFLTCGHVDDGKSTFIGRLLHDMGAVPQDQIAQAFVNGKLDYSRLTDGLEDERAQGITIDVAYRYFRDGARHYRIGDTPGHLQYLRNMAVAAVDCHCAFLLVDAVHGLREQSLRHSQIAAFLGVKSFVIVVNKMDLIDYSQEKFNTIVDQYEKALSAWGYDLDVTFIPVSALEGENITLKSEKMPWYTGQSILSYLRAFTPCVQEASAVRFPVQNVIRLSDTVRGYQGFLSGSEIKVGDALKVVNSDDTVTVSALYHSGKEVQVVKAGQSVTVSVQEDSDIARGVVLSTPENPPAQTDQFKAGLVWLEQNPEQADGFQGLLKIHHQTETAFLEVENLADPLITVSVTTANPVICDAWEKNPRMGLFLLIEPETEKVKAIGKIYPSYLPPKRGMSRREKIPPWFIAFL
jgi:bifunctional enzyme CysN/CysC